MSFCAVKPIVAAAASARLDRIAGQVVVGMGDGESRIGLVGLAVMGQNFALNVASRRVTISVYNRTYARTVECVERARSEHVDEYLRGFEHLPDFVSRSGGSGCVTSGVAC